MKSGEAAIQMMLRRRTVSQVLVRSLFTHWFSCQHFRSHLFPSPISHVAYRAYGVVGRGCEWVPLRRRQLDSMLDSEPPRLRAYFISLSFAFFFLFGINLVLASLTS